MRLLLPPTEQEQVALLTPEDLNDDDGEVLADEGGGHRRDALLTVDKDLPKGRGSSVLQAHVGALPGDEVPDREAVVERIQKVSDLRGVPHEGALHLGDGDLPGLDPGEESLDRVLMDCVLGHVLTPVAQELHRQ